MAKRQNQATTDRVQQLVEKYLTATRTTEEAISLDDLANAVNKKGESALTPFVIKRLTEKYRAATTSVERGNRLEELARLTEKTGSAALKWCILESAEASTKKADDMLRIAAIKLLPGVEFPNGRYEQRVIDFLLGRLDIPKSWPGEERIYAVDALRSWLDKPRVLARVLRLVQDENEREDLRSLALGGFALRDRGEVPAKVIKMCERFSGDTIVGRAAASVLRSQGIEPPEHEPEAKEPEDGSMTEAQWLKSSDLTAMLAYLQPGATKPKLARKLRLLTCACCRHIWSLMRNPEARTAVEVGEQFADGLVDKAKRRETERLLREITDDDDAPAGDVTASWAIAAETRSTADFRVAPNAAWAASCAVEAARSPKNEKAFQGALVRDIFGNPFQPSPTDPRWLTWRQRTIPKLAQAVYDERKLSGGEFDPKRLATLADALEKAGCTNADILGHLRGPGPHVRGCWVIDLLLEKP